MRQLTCFLCVILFISACRDKVICPAFQSTYILDDSVRLAYFSYLWKLDDVERISYLEKKRAQKEGEGVVALSADTLKTDSLSAGKEGIDYFAYVEPMVVPTREVNKNKYGIIKYEPYWLKNYRMRTAPMENVLAPQPEEEIQPLADESALAVNIDSDSTLSVTSELETMPIASETDTDIDSDTLSFLDSDVVADAAPVKKEKKAPRYLFKYDPKDNFNVEQEYYNKWFGEQLVYKEPKPKPPVEPLAKDKEVEDAGVVKPENIVDDSTPNDAEVNAEEAAPTDQATTEQTDTAPVTEPAPREAPALPPAQPPVEIESVPQDDGF